MSGSSYGSGSLKCPIWPEKDMLIEMSMIMKYGISNRLGVHLMTVHHYVKGLISY